MSWGDSDLGRGADEKLYRVADAASWVPLYPLLEEGLFIPGSHSRCIAISRNVPGFEGVDCGDGVLTGIACARKSAVWN